MTAPRSVALYARISKDSTGEGLGVERQLQDCRKHAAQLGWPLADEYVDNDISAYSGKPRPQYRRMLADLRAGHIDGVIAYRADRLHRSPLELEEYITVCENAGALTRMVASGLFDLSTADGRYVARMHGAGSRAESEKMSERMRRANRQHAEQGRPITRGQRKYGYENDRVTIREGEARVIRELAERFLAGESLVALVRWLNDSEIPTATGHHTWWPAGVRTLLRSPRISGQREYNGEIVAAGQWPAIITPEQTAAIRRVLDNPARRNERAPSRYLLTKLIVCGKCDRGMISHPRKGVPGYDCRSDGALGGCGKTSVVAEPTEELVRDMVLDALDGPDLAAAITTHDQGDVDAEALADAIRTDEARLNEMAVTFADGEMNRDQFRTANKRISDRLTTNRDRLAALGGRREMARYVGRGSELRRGWESMTLDQRRAVIRSVVEAVVIGPAGRGGRFDAGRVAVRWRV